MNWYLVFVGLFLFGESAAALINMSLDISIAGKVARGIRCVFCLGLMFWTIALAV